MDDGGKAGIFHTEYAVFPFFYGIFRLFYRMWRKTRPSFPQVLKSVWKTIHKGREAFPAETVLKTKNVSGRIRRRSIFIFKKSYFPKMLRRKIRFMKRFPAANAAIRCTLDYPPFTL